MNDEHVRESDRILAEDLKAARLPHLAERARLGEWNDFFGIHDMPQHHLIATLKDEVKLANVVRKSLIDDIMNGKYDATATESREWAESPEGQETFNALIRPPKTP